ncbi:MAG: 50S ribosomal protein L4 [Nitrospirae bacterium]|nr:MAG: 50S ribosomal protein L4 [Nitrospirota bacterium]
MPEIEVKDRENKVVGKITLPENIFGLKVKKDILHAAVVNYLANQRQGTHATKTRGMVSGGGKKPWRQKHTGRARHGSIRSPLWKGGGVVFGPQPRDYSYKLPKKQKRLALKIALSAKLKDDELTVVDSINFDKPRTKDMVTFLKGLGLDSKSVLIVTEEKDDNVYLSARNIPGVDVMRAQDLNTYEILVHQNVVITRDALKKIQEVWG